MTQLYMESDDACLCMLCSYVLSSLRTPYLEFGEALRLTLPTPAS